jgi:hypothetical protein
MLGRTGRDAGFALAGVVAMAALLFAAGAGCKKNGGGGGGNATCQTAMNASFTACGEAPDTAADWVESCQTDQEEYNDTCGTEFQAMLNCEARPPAGVTCETRCANEWEDLLYCETPCDACYIFECQEEAGVCDANAECVALFNCAGECTSGDTACYQTCMTDHPDGYDDFMAYLNCLDAACTEYCDD